MQIKRHEDNPVVMPGGPDWRRVAVFNPAVILENGRFYMFERACSSLDPLKCQVGLLVSDDGVNFAHVRDEPVLKPEDFDAPHGTVEDPRVVKIDGQYIMTFVFRRWVATCMPTGFGVPRYREHPDVPPEELNNYQSGIAVSDDMINWRSLGMITPPDIHDRDCILFPEKVGGKYVMLRRPTEYVGEQYGCDAPSMWLSYGTSLTEWDDPVLVAAPEQPWEAAKIGGAAPPILTDHGWLTLYHGVDSLGRYRVGAMLLDKDEPHRLLARTRDYFMEPETYYERVGVIIPNTIFPTANVVKDGTVYIYYGCTDSCISLATVKLNELLEVVR